MELFNPKFWEVALNAAALLLCCITVIYIVGRQRSLKEPPAAPFSDEIISSIAQKTFYNLMRQQTGNSFPDVRGRGKSPDTRVGKTSRQLKSRSALKKSKPAAHKPIKEGIIHLAHPAEAASNDSNTLKIYQFHNSGMSMEKISEKLSMPRCEVELFTKFQQRTGLTEERMRV